MKIINVTHNDMDGFVSGWLARKFFGCHTQTRMVGYNTVDDAIKTAVLENPDILIVTDISGGFDALKRFLGKLVVCDHHSGVFHKYREVEEYRKEAGNGAEDIFLLSNDCSASKLFAETFGLHTDIIDVVDQYDMTGQEEGQPGILNALYYLYPCDDFEKILERGEFRLTEDEWSTFREYDQRRSEYFDRIDISSECINGYNVAFLDIGHYHRYVMYRLTSVYDIVVCRYRDTGNLSLRSLIVPVDRIAQSLGGGGHRNAAGVPVAIGFSEVKEAIANEVQ